MTAAERLAALRGTASPDVTEALRRAFAACAPAPAPSRPAPFVCPDCGALVFADLAEAAHVCPDCGARWTASADW